MSGYFIEGELPQSGPIPAMRTGGQIAGFRAALPDFPEEGFLARLEALRDDPSLADVQNLIPSQ